MATYNGTDSDAPFPAQIQLTDAGGNPVPPDDIPVWQSSDATIASIDSTSPDGTEATIKVAGREGSCTLTATTVNKSGTKIVLTGSVIIAAGDAAQGEIVFPSTVASPVVAPSDPTAPSVSAAPGDTTTSASSDSGTSAPAPDASGSWAADQSTSSPAPVG